MLFCYGSLNNHVVFVHDTIVVFDKIREYRRTSALPIEDLANRAIDRNYGNDH